MKKRLALLLILQFLLTNSVVQAVAPSNGNSEKCFTVHGRYAIYVERDSIWIVGTKRLLDTTSDNLDQMIRDKGDWEDYVIFGDFTVCPVSRYVPGHMQTVTIQSYKNLRLAKRQ